MPTRGETAKATIATMAAGTANCAPKSSITRTQHATGVFDAAPKTAPRQTAAAMPDGNSSGADMTDPKVAPTTNNGVTSPPGIEQPRATAVKTILSNGSHQSARFPSSACSMSGSDNPR